VIRRAPPRAPEQTSLQGETAVPMQLAAHLPAIEARVNGKGPYRFTVDTGFGPNWAAAK